MSTLRLFSYALAASLLGAALPSVAVAQPAAASAQGSARDFSLAIGEQRIIPADGINRFSEGVPGIVDVRVPGDNSRLIVVGARAGSTSLVLFRTNGSQETYQITVYAMNPARIQSEIEPLLEGYTGVQIRRVGARLYLEGGVASEAQQRRVSQIASNYNGQVESLVTIDPTIVERRINIRLDLYFVEFRSTAGHQFGINWPTAIGGGGTVQNTLQANYNVVRTGPPGMEVPPGFANAQAIVSQPLPRLDIASNGGWARVLRQATLITANGNEASYRNGGEYNVVTQTLSSQTLTSITYGTNLTVTPRFDPQSSRIDLRVTVDVSDLADRAGTSTPGRDTSHLETLVNLQLGQSIVMSGFRSRQYATGTAGLPLLRQIPILGYLFGSERSRSDDVEGMIFIVPTVVEGMSRTALDRVAEALRQYERYSGDVDDLRLYEPTGAQYR